MKKVLLGFGTRPEANKMAPLILVLQEHFQNIEAKVCVTVQHREMLNQVLHIFDIVPDFDLDIMKAGQDLYKSMRQAHIPYLDGKSCQKVVYHIKENYAK